MACVPAGFASNLYAMGAQDKVVQRILRRARPHVTKECYISVLDRTVLEAMEKLQSRIKEIEKERRESISSQNWVFGAFVIDLRVEAAMVLCRFLRIGQQRPALLAAIHARLLIANAGEVAERLKAAVC